MKIGIIAGNRLLPLLLARKIREKLNDSEIVAICFRGDTSAKISNYVDRTYWIKGSSLGELREIVRKENLKDWIMAGQINPMRIFRNKDWDKELALLADKAGDFRPHTIFFEIIKCLEQEGVRFVSIAVYLKEYFSHQGVMNGVSLSRDCRKDIDFGVEIISRYAALDVGQTIVVKRKSVVALESLEGTDRTILRGYKLAGGGVTILKFGRINQDLRFDIPVVGISTLKLLCRIKAAALVLERDKVVILEKDKFLSLAGKWKIPIIGAQGHSL